MITPLIALQMSGLALIGGSMVLIASKLVDWLDRPRKR